MFGGAYGAAERVELSLRSHGNVTSAQKCATEHPARSYCRPRSAWPGDPGRSPAAANAQLHPLCSRGDTRSSHEETQPDKRHLMDSGHETWSKIMELKFEEYHFIDDKSMIDVDRVVELLHKTYWAGNRDRTTIEKSIENSLCFAVMHKGNLIGFARAVTDQCIYALLLDIVIDEKFRKKGLGKRFVQFITTHPRLSGASQVLWTKDAQSFYSPFGFKEETGFSVMFKRPTIQAEQETGRNCID
jgi:N-acetylglutamate synthase-like GNAT family acetyltransferase